MRALIESLPGSKIREVANAGLGRDDVLPFWFGESDEITPEPVREAAIASLQAGETMYAHNLGLAELRSAIAAYASTLHPALGAERIAVTSSGVSATSSAAGPADVISVGVVTIGETGITAVPSGAVVMVGCTTWAATGVGGGAGGVGAVGGPVPLMARMGGDGMFT